MCQNLLQPGLLTGGLPVQGQTATWLLPLEIIAMMSWSHHHHLRKLNPSGGEHRFQQQRTAWLPPKVRGNCNKFPPIIRAVSPTLPSSSDVWRKPVAAFLWLCCVPGCAPLAFLMIGGNLAQISSNHWRSQGAPPGTQKAAGLRGAPGGTLAPAGGEEWVSHHCFPKPSVHGICPLPPPSGPLLFSTRKNANPLNLLWVSDSN